MTSCEGTMKVGLERCYARREGDRLVMGNDCLEREFDWNGGDIVTRAIRRQDREIDWQVENSGPDLAFPGTQESPVEGGELLVREVSATGASFEHLEVSVTFSRNALWVKRVFSIVPGVAAIRCELHLKGHADGPWYSPYVDAAAFANMENLAEEIPAPLAPVLDRIALNRAHVQCCAVEFRDVTDRHNNLVHSVTHVPYHGGAPIRGNVLLVRDALNDRGLFFLKEAPCSSVQLAYPGYDFEVSVGEVNIVGPGVRPADLSPDDWTRAYGWVMGVADATEAGLLLALRAYQATGRRMLPERDEMIVVNTWGDRSQDSRMCEAFVFQEIDSAARLGATHLQLDDGWQNGRTSNSAEAGGTVEAIWSRTDFWDVHPTRFPNGLRPILERAADNGLKIALWYAPSRTHEFADWEKDAAQLIKLWREYGVQVFKIDMVKLPTKRADLNLRALFDRVLVESGGAISFNLDATANRRFGYHDAAAYGNVFLENRYTDWRNYYPFWTLRNLWMLSRYVPPQRLQIECLNTWRNAGNYPSDDPLAPAAVGFGFGVAVTLAAQPLFWFESASLPEEAFGMADAIRTYRLHQAAIHANPIMPIGEEPSGTSWTGFQSIGDSQGYLLIYREHTERTSFPFRLWAVPPATRLTLTPLIGQGEGGECTVGADGDISLQLPERWNYALYRYVAV